MKKGEKMSCEKKCEVYSRIVGYFRPVSNWNIGKKEEFKDRLEYDDAIALSKEFENEETVCQPFLNMNDNSTAIELK